MNCPYCDREDENTILISTSRRGQEAIYECGCCGNEFVAPAPREWTYES